MRKNFKPRHPYIWFKCRVGQDIIKGDLTLFSGPVYIESVAHAKALYASQDKGYRYKQ